jgi:hypothetical protein
MSYKQNKYSSISASTKSNNDVKKKGKQYIREDFYISTVKYLQYVRIIPWPLVRPKTASLVTACA